MDRIREERSPRVADSGPDGYFSGKIFSGFLHSIQLLLMAFRSLLPVAGTGADTKNKLEKMIQLCIWFFSQIRVENELS